MPMAAGWAKACWAFAFVDGTEVGGLDVAEGVELGDSVLIAIGVAVIEGGHARFLHNWLG